jgi:curved DNA-binding protein CbpA
MNPINKKTHYQTLKVTQNAKQYVIDAAYRALLQDIELSKRDAELTEKIKKILNTSYAVLSDPAQRAAYDKSLTLAETDKTFTKPVISSEPEKISVQAEKPSVQPKPETIPVKPETISVKKESVTPPAPEEKKTTPKFNYAKTIIIASSLIGVGIVGYLGYKFYPQIIQDAATNSDIQKETTNSIAAEGTKETNSTIPKENVDQIVTTEQKQVETKTNAENSIQEKKSYDSVVQTEKKTDVERLNARKSRRDNLLAK